MATYSAGSASIAIRPDLRNFRNRVVTQLKKIDVEHDVHVNPDLSKFGAKLEAQLNQLSRDNVDIGVNVDTSKARARLATLTKDRDINVDVDVNTGRARTELASLARQGNNTSRSLAMIGAKAGGIATIGTLAVGAIPQVAALASAIASVAGSLAVLPAAIGGGLATIATLGVGVSGMGAAFSSMGDSAAAAGGGAAAAMKDTARAVDAARDAIEDAEHGIVQAQRGVRDAEREVAQTQKDSLRAQEGLNDAREDAVRQLEDMNDRLNDAALNEEGAVLAIARAQQRLQETMADPKSSRLDVAEANLSYREAVDNLEDLRRENERLATDVAEANAAGVEGSEDVVAAHKDISDAQWAELQAAEGLSDAQWDLSEAHENLADAQQQLSDALTDFGEAAGGAAGGVDKFAEAMANLSPEAREFVLAIRELSDEWKDLRFEVQDSLFRGMAEDITDLAGVQLPVLKEGLSGIATEINSGVRSSMSQFSTELAALDFATFLDNTAQATNGLADAVAPWSQIWMDVSVVGSEYLPAMGDAIGDVSSEWADMVSEARANGGLNAFIDDGIDNLGRVINSIKDASGVIQGVFTAANSVGQPLLTTLSDAADLTHQWVDSTEGQDTLINFFETTSGALLDIAPALGEFAGILTGDIIPGIAGFVSGAAPGLTDFLGSLSSALDTVVDVAPGVGEVFGDILSAASPLAPVLSNLIENVALGAEVAGVLSAALKPVTELMGEHPGLVSAAITAYAGFKTIPGVVDRVSTAFAGGTKNVKGTSVEVKGLNGHLQPAGQNMMFFGESVRDAYRFAGEADPKLGTFGKTMEVVGGQGGIAATAMDGVRTGAGNLVNFLGGPWGVAMIVATGALAALSDANTRAKDAEVELAGQSEATAEAQRELEDAVAGTSGALGEDGLAAAAQLAKAEMTDFTAVGEQLDGFISKTRDLGDTFRMSGEELRAHDERMRTIKGGYEELQDVTFSMGISLEDVNTIIAEGGPQYDELVDKLRASGDAGNYAADEIEATRQRILDSIDAARRLDPGMRDVAEAVGILSDEASTADDKLGALETMMQNMGLIPLDAERAMMEASEAIREVAERATEAANETGLFGDALFDMDGKLNSAVPNAKALWDEMDDLSETLRRVASSGGDTGAKFEEMQPALQKLQDEFQLSDEKMESLIGQFGLVPDTLDMLMRLEGISEAEEQIRAVVLGLDGVPDNKQVEVSATALTDDAMAQLEAMGIEVEKIDENNVGLTVDDAQARGVLEWWMGEGFPAIDFANPIAKANLDPTGLLFNAEYAQYQIDNLDLQRPNPLASMDIGSLNQSQIDALNAVGLLDGQTPTPDAYMQIGDLTREQQVAMGQVFDLADERPRPVASLENKALKDGVTDSKGWLDTIPGLKEIKVVFSAVYEGFKDKLFGDDDGAATGGFYNGAGFQNRFAAGGVMPDHGGYRLPTTGPGTDVVDGFTAFNSDMVPAARLDAGEWVINGRSSDKYDRELRAINAGTFPKLPGFAAGGVLESMESYVGNNHPALLTNGKAFSGLRFTDNGYHSKGMAADFSNGGDAGTPEMARLAQDIYRNFKDQTLELIHWPLNGFNNVWHGQDHSYDQGTNMQHRNHVHWAIKGPLQPVSYQLSRVEGAGLNIPGDKTYGDYVPGTAIKAGSYTPVDDQAVMEWIDADPNPGQRKDSDSPRSWSEVVGRGAKAAAEGYTEDLLSVFGIPDSPPFLEAYGMYMDGQKSNAVGAAGQAMASYPVPGLSGTPPVSPDGDLAQMPPSLNFPSSLQQTIKMAYDPAKGVEQWRATVRMAMQRHGMPLDPHIEDITLKQIDIESSGDPNAMNHWDSNAAQGMPSGGLLQVIEPTFQSMRAQYSDALNGLPNNRMHPLANVTAGIAWADHAYGGPANIWPTRAGYAEGGSVWGSGGPTDDSIAAWLSDREFVTRAAVADVARPLLSRMNEDPGFASQLTREVMAPPASDTQTTQDGPTYQIVVQSVDEGIRKAEMMERRRLSAMGII